MNIKKKKPLLFWVLLISLPIWSQKSLSSLPGEMILVEAAPFDWNGRQTKCPMNYYISKYEVTQGLWKEVTGKNPSYFGACGLDCPVEQVNWYEAMVFCNELSEQLGLEPCYYEDGGYTKVYGKLPNGKYNYSTRMNPEWNLKAKGFRLPLDVEWEFAARGGKRSRGYTYSGSEDDINSVAWYQGNSQVIYTPNGSGKGTHAVGKKLPNELGLLDISGNVSEWSYDSYADFNSTVNYNACSTDGKGSYQLLRGGNWGYFADYCVVSNCKYNFYSYYSAIRTWNIGMRLVRSSSK